MAETPKPSNTTIDTEELVELPVCPKMRCNSFLAFPEVSPTLPCARHGLVMVPLSEAPLSKKMYRFIIERVYKFKYATHKSKDVE